MNVPSLNFLSMIVLIQMRSQAWPMLSNKSLLYGYCGALDTKMCSPILFALPKSLQHQGLINLCPKLEKLEFVGLGQNDPHDLDLWVFVVKIIECVALAKRTQCAKTEYHTCSGLHLNYWKAKNIKYTVVVITLNISNALYSLASRRSRVGREANWQFKDPGSNEIQISFFFLFFLFLQISYVKFIRRYK